jgi:hypothetical protein
MNSSTFIGSAALVLLGAGVTALALRSAFNEPDPILAGLAGELIELQTQKPDPVQPPADSDPSRHRIWSPDPRDAAFQAPAVTAEIGWFDEDGQMVAARTIARSDTAIQFGADGDPRLFRLRRNPLDPARMSGCEIVPAAHLILDYTEADLRDEGYGQSWAALAQFGVTADAFDQMVTTSKTESAFGLTFCRWVAATEPEAASGSPREIWWNSEYRLPLRVVRMQDGAIHEQRLLALDLSAPATLELEPFQRWPDYESVDLMDYREGLHEHAGH